MYKQVKNANDLIEQSKEYPLLLFKESMTDPISMKAKEEVDAFVSDGSPYPVFIITTEEQQEVSEELAEKLKVKHEVPQMIFVKDGKAIDTLSHRDVTTENIEEMVQ